ncbi:MAG: hypothetical protein H6873_05625 [Hyphomicrobiaceae bacterium]|nr:hypothetical protein [Hyphomicrobiaceae bacterium]
MTRQIIPTRQDLVVNGKVVETGKPIWLEDGLAALWIGNGWAKDAGDAPAQTKAADPVKVTEQVKSGK